MLLVIYNNIVDNLFLGCNTTLFKPVDINREHWLFSHFYTRVG